MRDLCIIGAGASGLTAAITAARRGKKVTLIERNEKCGKKLLITGNGKCNYFNIDQDISHYSSNNLDKIKEIINKDNLNKVLTFFDSLGIEPKIKNGYYYPTSESSITIQNALIYEAKRLNIEIINGLKVEKIIKENAFVINPKTEKIKTKKIIIASGGMAAPKTGSDGSGYDLAKSLNHSIINPKPSLVQLRGNEPYFKKWNGIRADAEISIYENEIFIKKERGTLQLTDYGISGIVSFNLSRYISRKIKENKIKVMINFIPWINENPSEYIKKKRQLSLPISVTLERILNYKLVNVILKKSQIKTDSFDKISDKDLSKLIRTLTQFELIITDTNSFDKAQTTIGGIPLDEINLKTMESLKTKDLYLTGEIIDIDGDCGGYNLTIAWITGLLAGENI